MTIAAASFLIAHGNAQSLESNPATEAQAIAEEAYLYGFPMIVGYDVFHQFFIDPKSP